MESPETGKRCDRSVAPLRPFCHQTVDGKEVRRCPECCAPRTHSREHMNIACPDCGLRRLPIGGPFRHCQRITIDQLPAVQPSGGSSVSGRPTGEEGAFYTAVLEAISHAIAHQVGTEVRII